jgi:hypothetical protein
MVRESASAHCGAVRSLIGKAAYMTFGTRGRVALAIAVAALTLVSSALALSGTTALDVTASGQASGDATDACLAYATCFWTYSGTAVGAPFGGPVRFEAFIDGGLQFDSIEACFPNATGTFRYFDKRSGRFLLEQTVAGQYCVTRPFGSHFLHTFTGTYTVTGVVRPLKGAGTGTVTLTDDLAGHTFEARTQGTLTVSGPGAR